MMMFLCIKQHLSNTWSLIHEKVREHWGWAEKKHVENAYILIQKKHVDIPLYENNILWEVTAPRYKEYEKKNIRENKSFKCIFL